jgi:GT2 family glycosyltransferase
MRRMEPLSPPITLSVSLVLFHSDIERFAQTVRSLATAVTCAQNAGRLKQVSLVVLDNSTDPGYAESARQALARSIEGNSAISSRYLVAPGNSGYGAGHNLAAREASSDLHLVLNPDVDLAEQALAQGVEELLDPTVVLVAPRVAADDGADVVLASGCFMLLRSAAFRAVGGFDERYFLYFEDYDLSMRLAGEGVLRFQPAMAIVHHGGYAASKGWRHIGLFMRSGYRFFSQYGWQWI